MSPSQWKKRTNAIGIIPSSGRYSKGTYVHPDIALEFASWIDTSFKLYLIKEFEQEDEWNKLPISTPPYTVCSKCRFDKCVPMNYKSKREFHHIYKEEISYNKKILHLNVAVNELSLIL